MGKERGIIDAYPSTNSFSCLCSLPHLGLYCWAYSHKAPATTGAFYCFNHTKNPTNQAFNTWHHWQQNSQRFHPPSRLIHPQKMQGRANKASAFFSPTSIHIPSTQLPNTSLHVAITDAIRSSKSHRHLMPLLWNLIEPDVKGKG